MNLFPSPDVFDILLRLPVDKLVWHSDPRRSIVGIHDKIKKNILGRYDLETIVTKRDPTKGSMIYDYQRGGKNDKSLREELDRENELATTPENSLSYGNRASYSRDNSAPGVNGSGGAAGVNYSLEYKQPLNMSPEEETRC